MSDGIILDLVGERGRCLRCCGEFVLDGFPRTVAQAEALLKLLDREAVGLDSVFNYELPLDEIVSRLGGRRVCPECKAVYHLTRHPPKRTGICDRCGKRPPPARGRQAQAIRTRMRAYEESTKPLLDWYGPAGLLVTNTGTTARPERNLRADLDLRPVRARGPHPAPAGQAGSRPS